MVTFYRILGSKINETIKYIMSYWNAVDMRYRKLDNPKVRINVAGIIIAEVCKKKINKKSFILFSNKFTFFCQDYEATPYVLNQRVAPGKVQATGAIIEMGKLFKADSRFPKDSFDVIMLMTAMDICGGNKVGCESGTIGKLIFIYLFIN